MKTKDIVAECYYEVATDRAGRGGARILAQETARVLRIIPRAEVVGRTGKPMGWFAGPFVVVRRFLMGGYIDVEMRPHDILREVEPHKELLAMIHYVEEKVGPKPVVRKVTTDTTEAS